MNEEQKLTEQNIPSQDQTATTSENEVNWKKFREERAKERQAAKESEEARRRAEEEVRKKNEETEALKKALEAVVSKPSYIQQETEETEDQRLERLLEEKLLKREQQLIQQREQEELKRLPEKMKKTFSDFEAVCSLENVDYLAYHHPEIHRTLKKLPDNFENWSDIYHTMKKLIPNPDSKKDEKKAAQNFMKPQSVSMAGMSSTGDIAPSMSLSDQRRKDNWNRMMKIMRGGK